MTERLSRKGKPIKPEKSYQQLLEENAALKAQVSRLQRKPVAKFVGETPTQAHISRIREWF